MRGPRRHATAKCGAPAMSSLAQLWAKHASAPVSPGVAAAAAARAAREKAEADEVRRSKEARTYLMSIWSISEVHGAHRPSKEEALRRQQIPVLAREYASAGGEQSPKEWLLGDACRALCTAKGWHLKEHGPAEATMQSAPASSAEAVATGSLEAQVLPLTETATPKFADKAQHCRFRCRASGRAAPAGVGAGSVASVAQPAVARHCPWMMRRSLLRLWPAWLRMSSHDTIKLLRRRRSRARKGAPAALRNAPLAATSVLQSTRRTWTPPPPPGPHRTSLPPLLPMTATPARW